MCVFAFTQHGAPKNPAGSATIARFWMPKVFRAGLPILPRPTTRHRTERRRGGLAVTVLFVQLRGLPILSSKGQHLQIPFGGSPCAPILRLIHCICQGCCQNFVLIFRPPLQKPLGSFALLLGSLMCPSACPCMPLSLRFLLICQPLWLTQFWRQHLKWLPCGRLTADASIPAGDVHTAVSPHSSFASCPHSLASSLLESADFSHDSCVRLLHMAFPCPLRARRPGLLGDAPASYFVLGGFKCPPRQGITKLTASHEPLVKYLNHWLMHVFAGRSWSSLVVSHNTCTGVHMDRNAQGTLNFCTALGSFTGGGIWLESETGDTAFWDSSSSCLRMGQVLEVHNAACVFDGAKRHATMPWAGDRWLLIAYTSVNEHDVSGEDWAKLGSLSFPCVQQHAQSVLRPVETFTAEEPSVQVTSARAFPPPQGSAEAASSMQPPLQPCTAPEAVQPACPRLFLDLFSGARAPLSAALRQLPGSHLGPPDSFEPVDVIFGHHCDILDDENYARMLQVTGSGLVGAASAAPICSHHSILKLRKGGPAPVRTPWALDGLSSNTWQQALTAQESSLLHDRARELLLRVAVNGGLILFENPPSSLTFHDPLMKSWLRSVAPYISQVAACSHGLHLRKRWAFFRLQQA